MNLYDNGAFSELVGQLISRGYGDEINWSKNIQPCSDPAIFAHEAIWVILNSGMKNQVAQKIWWRIQEAWRNNQPTSTAFRHIGKVKAIDYIKNGRELLFAQYQQADNKIEWLKSLPWVGGITCYHLAKNLGLNVVKPDRWLVRVADFYNETPDSLCGKISEITGLTKHTIDLIIWRACNLGLITIENLSTHVKR